MLLDAILKLHDKVQHEPLGEKRRAALAELPEPVVKPGSMPSSYRFDKRRKKEWIEAAEAGTQEQLRIRKAVVKP
ncbi:hypothetical protein GCM10029992_20660 [Glycomyces albus]